MSSNLTALIRSNMESDPERLARLLWRLFDEGRFEEVAPLLADDFVCEWPQSRERIRGPANFISVNKNYPGRWKCRVLRVVDFGDAAVTSTEVTDGKTTVYATSFFECRGGAIVRATEYWGKCYPAPEWRAKWVERY